jgi:(p)ppGpp synthase/HD superfamily hydrolase
MHEIAEQGLAAHWKYKEEKLKVEENMDNWINWIRDIFEGTSRDETRREILEDFKLNLYQDEIYVFTPKGELRRLPLNSTPVDFAFEIHSKVGYHCIGAKINGRIVPLDTTLHSGDQVEIITSKNQHPNKSWLKFVKTHKAKATVRKWMNKEEEKIVAAGKEIWDKKIKRLKLSFNTDDISKLARKLKFDNNALFFKAIAQGSLSVDGVLLENKAKDAEEQDKILEFEKFADIARKDAGGILVDGKDSHILYDYAKCCSPIPGDPVIGYITVGEGVKIHRKTCKNLINLSRSDSSKLVPVQWPSTEGSLFVAGLIIKGEDSPGIVNEMANTIVSYRNTNIKSINISTNESTFEGSITLYVSNLEHLNLLLERLKKVKGLYHIERFEGS